MEIKKITQDQLDDLTTYMDDEIREAVHYALAPCTPYEFLMEYLKRDPSFDVVLKEFCLI